MGVASKILDPPLPRGAVWAMATSYCYAVTCSLMLSYCINCMQGEQVKIYSRKEANGIKADLAIIEILEWEIWYPLMIIIDPRY